MNDKFDDGTSWGTRRRCSNFSNTRVIQEITVWYSIVMNYFIFIKRLSLFQFLYRKGEWKWNTPDLSYLSMFQKNCSDSSIFISKGKTFTHIFNHFTSPSLAGPSFIPDTWNKKDPVITHFKGYSILCSTLSSFLNLIQ